MKKVLGIIAIAAILTSCDNVRINESKIDSAGEKLQNTVEKVADTVVNKVDKWTDSLRKDDRREDSLER